MDPARLIEKVFRPWRKPSCPSQLDPKELGQWGEQVAARHLQQNQYRILYRNYRARHGGEVDLVARHKPTANLCFIEVKTRSSEDYGRPSDAVDWKKQRLIVRGALDWLRLLDHPEVIFRFDIVEVVATTPPKVEIIENAFELPGDIYY